MSPAVQATQVEVDGSDRSKRPRVENGSDSRDSPQRAEVAAGSSQERVEEAEENANQKHLQKAVKATKECLTTAELVRGLGPVPLGEACERL